jgi:SAM-dependent methyltransferase
MKLNLGCGNNVYEAFIGVDRYPCAGARVLCDLTGTLPFRDSSVDEMLLQHVVEHILDIAALMREVVRIGKPGARVRVVTPHFSSLGSWKDPTHIHHLSYFSMDHFEKPSAVHYTGGGLVVEARRLSFSHNLLGAVGRLLFRWSPLHYEKHFCFVFRARSLEFDLRVIKNAKEGVRRGRRQSTPTLGDGTGTVPG